MGELARVVAAQLALKTSQERDALLRRAQYVWDALCIEHVAAQHVADQHVAHQSEHQVGVADAFLDVTADWLRVISLEWPLDSRMVALQVVAELQEYARFERLVGQADFGR